MYKDKYDGIVPPIHKFGPVTVNLNVRGERKDYDSGDERPEDISTSRAVGSAALACVYLMIGANIMLTYIYSIHWHLKFINNLHILFCSAGFQLLIPMGILMQSKINGPSQSLTKVERTTQHMVLQIAGAAMGIIGAICVVLFGATTETKWSFHCLTGIVTVGFAVLSLIFGVASKMRAKFSAKHPVYGVATYLLSSICFILGTIKNDFIVFVPMSLAPDVVYLMIIFCSISTLIVIFVPIRHMARPEK